MTDSIRVLSCLYAIADAGVLNGHRAELQAFSEDLRAAGVDLIQYRNKTSGPQSVLRDAAVIGKIFAGTGCRLILNDRADLAVLAGWDAVHVGQGDLSPEDAKRVLAANEIPCLRVETRGTHGFGHEGGMVGVSTHTQEQVRIAELSCADYVAVGPVFATGTKLDVSPVVGLDFVRRARALTSKPLVAIGGITRANARSVIEAGADSVAVISGLLVPGESAEKVARDFLEILR